MISAWAEEQERAVGKEVITSQVLNLLTDKGLVGIPLWDVTAIKLLDTRLDEDLHKALAAIAQAQDKQRRPVTITVNGKGTHTVRIGYLLDTPVWKTSYRLVADDKGMALQGWAVVENTTDEDWNNVGLSLVSGRPVSFIQDLYTPLYLTRPTVAPSVAVAAAPRTWEGRMDDEKDTTATAAAPAPSVRPAPAPGAGGGVPSLAAAKTMGYANTRLGVDAHMLRDALTTRGLAESGAAGMAAGEKVGSLFRYAINQPVTIPRQRSAMVPILNSAIEGERLSVYNAGADRRHPMNGIMLKNTSELHLNAGALTVFVDGTYGGDALIEDIAPGDKRLLTYAMDLAIEVNPEAKSLPSEYVSAKVVRGVMTLTHTMRTETTYVVKSAAADKRTVLVEHPRKADWKLTAPAEPDETTRTAYRFRVPVEPGKSASLKVAEERPMEQVVRLTDSGSDQVKLLLQMPTLTPAIKEAITRLLVMQRDQADLTARRAEMDTRLKEIEQEQERIRKNMAQLDRQSQLYRQYVEKFAAQEQEFDRLRTDIRTVRTQEAAGKKAIQDYLAGLNLE